MFHIGHQRLGEWDVFEISGALNETAEAPLVRLLGSASGFCRFNLAGVNSVNSNGIRAWLLFLRDFGVRRVVELVECSPEVLEQLNMLPSFHEGATVQSVHVIYACDTCQAEHTVLVKAADFAAAKRRELPHGCPRCGSPALPQDDFDPFAFVKY